MTHPSVEQIAEHLEGLLDRGSEERVRAHLDRCDECAATAHVLEDAPRALRAAAEWEAESDATVMPEHLTTRVQDAIAAESRSRASETAGRDETPRHAGGPPAAPHAQREGQAPVGVTGGQDQRARRRRRLAGGLLAAAALTVAAVGVAQVWQDAGLGGGAGGSAGSAVRAPAEQEGLLSEQEAGAPGATGRQPRPQAGANGAAARVAARAALIDGVAAAHVPDRRARERLGCVRAAVGPQARPGASYAVTLPEGPDGTPAVVLLRPAGQPTRGVLIECEPRPRVLQRRALSR